MCATVVSLACGVVGVVAILVAVSTGHKFDHASSQVDPALAELLYDFAALQAAGMPSATAQVGFVLAPEPAPLALMTTSRLPFAMKPASSEPLRKPSRARTISIASAIWGVSIFLSRIMGLVREQIIGRTFGASREADLYFASFTLPDFLNYLLGAGALSIVFIPMFLEYFGRGDRDGGPISRMFDFASSTSSCLVWWLRRL
jgi:hypothetical protein